MPHNIVTKIEHNLYMKVHGFYGNPPIMVAWSESCILYMHADKRATLASDTLFQGLPLTQ